MVFTTASVISWTALIAFFLTSCLVRTAEASETLFVIAACLNIAVLTWFVTKAFFTRGLDVFSVGFLITYATIETLQIIDGFSIMSELSYRLDLWIRYLLPNHSGSNVWKSRQETNLIMIQFLFCVAGGFIGIYCQRKLRHDLVSGSASRQVDA